MEEKGNCAILEHLVFEIDVKLKDQFSTSYESISTKQNCTDCVSIFFENFDKICK